jgi:hypothetical protein
MIEEFIHFENLKLAKLLQALLKHFVEVRSESKTSSDFTLNTALRRNSR